MTNPKIDRIAKLPEVEQITGLKKTSIYKLMNEGNFPLSVKLGARAVGWKMSNIQEWLNNLHAAEV